MRLDGYDNDEEDDDSRKMSCAELRQILRLCGLPDSKVKSLLMYRFITRF